MSHLAQTDPKVVVALDFPKAELALQFVEQLQPGLCRLKVGKELFALGGPQLVGKADCQRF